MKLAFNLAKDKEFLWARVIKIKYKCGGKDTIPSMNKVKKASNVWKGISNVWPKVRPSLIVVQNGEEEIMK